MSRSGAALLFSAATAVTVVAAAGQYGYDQPGDRRFVSNTAVLERTSPGSANNQSQKIAAPRAQVKAAGS